MRKLSIFILGFLALTVFDSCKRTLDVNNNPNAPTDVPVEVLLPSAQASIGQQLGNYFQIIGGIWGQYWTQNTNSSQYKSLEQYQPGPTTANTAWTELYAGALTDLDVIVKKADTLPALQNYKAVALITKAYTFQLLTDNFGDIPFTEALKGNQGISSPKYDAQELVYTNIIAMVKEGQSLIDPSLPTPSSDDLIYGGDMEQWDRFASTLLLRMYLRLAYVNPGLAQQGIQSLSGASFIEANGGKLNGSAGISYKDQSGNTNPLYSEIKGLSGTQNLIASATAFDELDARGDARLDAFYLAIGGGLEQGYYSIPLPGTYALPGPLTGGLSDAYIDAYGLDRVSVQTAPVKFISTYESYLLQAEATARTWLTGGEIADSLYNYAIRANYKEYAVHDSFANQYIIANPYPTGGSFTDQLKTIITEKWLCMDGNQCIEAWTEWRRTGYPDFFTISRNSRIGNVFPARLPYPEVELTRNLNFPGQKQVTDKVWWDVN